MADLKQLNAITDVPGVKVGHWTDRRRATGCTVVRVDGGAAAAYTNPGGAPGTIDTDLLRPENRIPSIHAVLLTGGSAYGLEAVLAHGLVKGGLLSVWRILRCQPFATGGQDPVPPAGSWRPAVGPRARAAPATPAAPDESGAAGRPAPPPAGRVPRPSEEETP